MTQDFKFELGQKVEVPGGKQGTVLANLVRRSCSQPRVDVEYVDDNGAVFDRWFDEDQLKVVEEES